MNINKTFQVIVLALFITACNSESHSVDILKEVSSNEIETEVIAEESTEDAAVEEVTGFDIETLPDVNAVYDSTKDLVSAKSFEIASEYELMINYKNESELSAYLSVCTDFTLQEEEVRVDYNSCLLRTSVETQYEATLTIPNDKKSVVMAIWYMDDIKNPHYAIWNNDAEIGYVKEFIVN